jgi:O-antigen/teichoic acid export membrane protein
MERGAAWNVLFRAADRGIGLVSTVILARLLIPADFGLVALATSLIGLLTLLGDFGFDLALIQHPNAQRRHFDTVWTFNVAFGLATAVVLLLLADAAARFYNEPRLVPVMFGLAAVRAISCFENIGPIIFRKDMAFDQDFKFSLYKRIATTFLATIPLAFLLRNYWALVGGMIAGSCIGLALSYLLHPYRPRLSLSAIRELLGFSKWLQIAHILSFASGRAADFIIGRIAGASALGLLTIAKEISNLPSAELTAPIHKGIFPGYAKIAANRSLLKRAYLRVTSVLVLIVVPAGVGLSLVAEPTVLVFFGEKWTGMVPLIGILAVNGVLGIWLTTAAYVYLALGMPRHTTMLVGVYAGVFLGMMVWLLPTWGLKGAAVSMLFGTIATMPLNFRFLSDAIGVTLLNLSEIVWRPVFAMLIMVGAVLTTRYYIGPAHTLHDNLVSLMAMGGIGAAVYCGTVMLLWHLASRPNSAEAFVLERLKSVFETTRSYIRIWLSK